MVMAAAVAVVLFGSYRVDNCSLLLEAVAVPVKLLKDLIDPVAQSDEPHQAVILDQMEQELAAIMEMVEQAYLQMAVEDG